jgi:hypothetical protein
VIYGLDVGRWHDRTALVGIEDQTWKDDEGAIAGRRVVVRLAEELPAMDLDHQFHAVNSIMRLDADVVAVDATGLGLGLAEALTRDQLYRVYSVTILGGNLSPGKVDGRLNHWRVGKQWLMERIRLALYHDRLGFLPSARCRDLISEQLAEMLPKRTKKGYAIEARKGRDDLVLALALALLARDIRNGSQARNPQHG